MCRLSEDHSFGLHQGTVNSFLARFFTEDSLPDGQNVLMFSSCLLQHEPMRIRLITFVLGFSLLGLVFLQQSAFSQEMNQETNKRRVTAKVPPKYPALARQLRLSGKVRVEVTVSPDGHVKSTRILGGSPLLANAALDAIRMWRYEGGAKETTEVVEIEFNDPNQ